MSTGRVGAQSIGVVVAFVAAMLSKAYDSVCCGQELAIGLCSTDAGAPVVISWLCDLILQPCGEVVSYKLRQHCGCSIWCVVDASCHTLDMLTV